jgi:hypothetical protein
MIAGLQSDIWTKDLPDTKQDFGVVMHFELEAAVPVSQHGSTLY